jgi:hypothetical protein
MQPQEQGTPIIWTAATCDFRGAGVYVGLAPEYEHLVVARGLGTKQMQAFVGGQMRARGEPRPWPIHYYAVRDPSAVRVIPVNQPALPNGFKPVQLRFRFPAHNGRLTVRVTPPGDGRFDHDANSQNAAAPSGFIVSVGMPADREIEFFDAVIDGRMETDWDEVFQRVAAYGCRGLRGANGAA